MTIQYKFFSVPIGCEQNTETELNHFLKTVRLINVQRELVSQKNQAYWAIVVEYMTGDEKSDPKTASGKKKIDYKEVLSPEDFEIYARLREWRKETAAREAKQLFTVFLNEHLATMVEKRITTKAGLKEIEGVGDVKVEKYGDAVITILKEEFSKLEKKNEAGQESLPFDPGA